METFSALLAIYAGNSPVPGEFPAQRPVTTTFDVFFDLGPNKLLSKNRDVIVMELICICYTQMLYQELWRGEACIICMLQNIALTLLKILIMHHSVCFINADPRTIQLFVTFKFYRSPARHTFHLFITNCIVAKIGTVENHTNFKISQARTCISHKHILLNQFRPDLLNSLRPSDAYMRR